MEKVLLLGEAYFMISEGPLYVIDERFSTYPMSAALQARQKLWLHPDLPLVPNPDSVLGDNDSPLPLSPDGTLVAGALYPSSVDPTVHYYLPHYQIHVSNGQYTTRLKYRGPNDDPDGPLGWLTIDLDALAPAANGFQLREIDHSAVVRIAYQMTVHDSNGQPIGATRVEDGSQIDDFVGDWVNTNTASSQMTRLTVGKVNATILSFHGYGKCEPTDCDWGVITVPFAPGTTVGTYNFGFKTTRITIQRSGDLLTATDFNHYAPGDGRTDWTSTETYRRADAPPVASSGPNLWIEVGALVRAEQNIRRCQKAIFLKQDFDRIYQIMTDSSFKGQLEIHCFATVGRRTWRQVVVGPITTATQLKAYPKTMILAKRS
jgi:hypothetical protein